VVNVKRQRLLGLLTMLLLVPPGICPAANPDFSGTWKQGNERSTPARKGDVTLHIDYRDSQLTVETTILRTSGAPQHALQHYTTDGKTSVSTGADGDEFHTAVIWRGPALVFSVEEHEDGRVILSQETWTLIENGAALERRREREGGAKDVIIYLREAPKP
jgi:hypothetical protein